MNGAELIALRAGTREGRSAAPRVHAALKRADGRAPRLDIAAIVVHPSSDFLSHYMMRPLPEAGMTLLALNTRYVGDDPHVIFEHLIADVGAAVRFLRDEGYGKVILLGNSGGASTAALYQAEAENFSITETVAGDPVDHGPDDLPPADAIALFGAHPGRGLVLSKWLDASLTDEDDPASRDPSLDIFCPENGPPFAPEFVARVRAAQRARSERITARAHARLAELRADPDGPQDEAFLVYRTVADPRHLDRTLDPNDRPPGMVFGDPRILNTSAAEQARMTTLTSWLSQWSLESRAHGPDCIRRTTVPVMNVEFTADTNVLPSDIAMWTEALGDRQELHHFKGATHFLIGQHEYRQELARLIADWARRI